MISLFISIFVLILIFSVIFSLLGLLFSVFFKFLGILIVGGIIAWIINVISGGRFFNFKNLNRNDNYRWGRYNNDWYVVNKRNRRKNNNQDHDEWSNF